MVVAATMFRSLAASVALPASTFVGRDDDVAALSALLGESRIVTLVGPGGIGKSRMSAHSAAGVSRATPDRTRARPLSKPYLVSIFEAPPGAVCACRGRLEEVSRFGLLETRNSAHFAGTQDIAPPAHNLNPFTTLPVGPSVWQLGRLLFLFECAPDGTLPKQRPFKHGLGPTADFR